ncbi:MAG: hypothetical protein IKQ72_07085 [Bacteroidaceae bacterium]|nr:hypothetical protein [Bacteroidaceae bacterium]
MNNAGAFRTVSADELSSDIERYIDLARRGMLYVRNDAEVILPECLMTPEAMRLWKRLQDAGWVDNDYRTIGLSYTQKAVLAMEMSKRLDVFRVWKVFGDLWDMKPDTLRSAYNKALGGAKYSQFYDAVRKMIG